MLDGRARDVPARVPDRARPLRPRAPPVRDSEIAATANGVSTAGVKTAAFGISAFFCGVAGSLYAIGITYVNPDTFPIDLSILLLVGIVLGGAGSLYGMIFGALFVEFIRITWGPALLDLFSKVHHVNTHAPGSGLVVYGVVLLLVLYVAPAGAAGLVRRCHPPGPKTRGRILLFRIQASYSPPQSHSPQATPQKERHRMKKTFLLIVAALAVSAVIGTTAGARPTATPGVTAKSILLEGTYPLSGPASGYAPIPVGMGAYFSYVNAHGGVNGRKINWHFEDDGYNPANTVQITHKFVEQDHAFAIVGGLGTEPQLAVRQYLNDNKVPQLFVATGATTFDRDYATYPWTIGWQPDYEAEGSIYGKYVAKNLADAKIGVLYQNDDYGNDYLRGFKAGLGRTSRRS